MRIAPSAMDTRVRRVLLIVTDAPSARSARPLEPKDFFLTQERYYERAGDEGEYSGTSAPPPTVFGRDRAAKRQLLTSPKCTLTAWL